MNSWQMYKGNIIPRSMLGALVASVSGSAPVTPSARLKIGQNVRVRVDSVDGVGSNWLSAIVLDIQVSSAMGILYMLAFPILPAGDHYVLSQNYPSHRQFGTSGPETCETSGLYTEEEFEAWLEEQTKDKEPPKRALSVVR